MEPSEAFTWIDGERLVRYRTGAIAEAPELVHRCGLEGATLLLREQADDGSWGGGPEQAVARTAHALLFLASSKR